MHTLTKTGLHIFTFFVITFGLLACGGGGGDGDTDPDDSLDLTPNAFSFAAKNDVGLDSDITSDTITVSGINGSVKISISGGEYAIGDTGFTTEEGLANQGDTVVVRVHSSMEHSTSTTATLTIGGVSAEFTATTIAAVGDDTTPDDFSFTAKTNVDLETWVPSSVATITGINTATDIRVENGEYAISGGTFTDAAGTINNGQKVVVRVRSSTENETSMTATLTIGGVSAAFTATTRGDTTNDTTPDAFRFESRSGVALSTQVTSNTVTISGINTAAPISVNGGEYSIDGGDFTSAEGSINNAQNVVVRVLSSDKNATRTAATLTIGGVSAEFAVTTTNGSSDDTTPDAFRFESRPGVALSTQITSNTVTISGINTAAPISVSGGEYAINGGDFTSAEGSINNAQNVVVRVLSSDKKATRTAATLTIGGVSSEFEVTTTNGSPDDTTPDPFRFEARADVALSTTVDSEAVIITGINAEANVSVNNGSVSINGGTFSSSSQKIKNGQSLAVGVMSSDKPNTRTAATVTVGGVSADFAVTTANPVDEDITPKAFSFKSKGQQHLNQYIESDIVKIFGLEKPSPISVNNGEYAINGLPFTKDPGLIMNKQEVVVRVLSAKEVSASTTATVTIGGVNANFVVTTIDTKLSEPEAFTFPAIESADRSLWLHSKSSVITGFTTPIPISVSGGSYSLDGQPFTAAAGSILPGQTLQLSVRSASEAGKIRTAKVTVGSYTTDFIVTTTAEDSDVDRTPDPLSFENKTDVGLDFLNYATDLKVEGMSEGESVPINILGPEAAYYIKGDDWTNKPGHVSLGDVIHVRVKSAKTLSTETLAHVTIGGVVSTFSVTTTDKDQFPDSFGFTSVRNADPGTWVTSEAVTIQGLNAEAIVDVGGEYGEASVDGGSFTAEPQPIRNGQSLRVRAAASWDYEGQRRILLQVGRWEYSTDPNYGVVKASFLVVTKTAPVSENKRPIPKMRKDIQIQPGLAWPLDGSESTDPDGEIVKYQWRQVAGVKGNLAKADQALASFTADHDQPNGKAYFTLTVTDNDGAMSTRGLIIEVVNDLGVKSFTLVRQPKYLSFNWDAVPDALSYHLYYASEPNLTPDNYQDLDKGGRIENVTRDYQLPAAYNDYKNMYFIVGAEMANGIQHSVVLSTRPTLVANGRIRQNYSNYSIPPEPNGVDVYDSYLNFSGKADVDYFNGTRVLGEKAWKISNSNNVNTNYCYLLWNDFGQNVFRCINASIDMNILAFEDVRAIKAGRSKACALTPSKLWCEQERLAIDTGTPRFSNATAFDMDDKNTCVTDDSGITCWDDKSTYEQAGAPSLSNPYALALGVQDHEDSLYAGCALDDAGLQCWGQLATHAPSDITNPTQLWAVGNAKVEKSTACVLHDEGLTCWDQDKPLITPALNQPYAFSGFGAYNNYKDEMVIDICALEQNGKICWTTDGQQHHLEPQLTADAELLALGKDSYCAREGDNINCFNIFGEQHFGGPTAALSDNDQVNMGRDHACLLGDAGVKCWGDNQYNQLDIPTLNNPSQLAVGSYSSCVVDNVVDNTNNLKVVCWGRSDWLNSPPDISDWDGVASISVGSKYGELLRYYDSDDVEIGGWNDEVSPPSFSGLIGAVTNRRNMVCGISRDDTKREFICWGGGELTLSMSLNNPKFIAAGNNSICALDQVGSNEYELACRNPLSVHNFSTRTVYLQNPNKLIGGSVATALCADDDLGHICWGTGFNENFGWRRNPLPY